MSALQAWKDRARRLRNEVTALALAMRDPRTPWYAKGLMAIVVAYAVSPIDLIPDFIPVLGMLDDFILIPLGVYLAVKMVPPDVLADCRRKAGEKQISGKAGWTAAAFIIVLWLAVAYWLYRILTD